MTKTIAKATTGLRIGAYIRVSTEEQADNPEGSIRNQEMRLRETVKLRNMEGNFGKIEKVFIDRAKSGKDTNRPELQKLLLAIRRKEIDLVLVSELSRLSRSIKDFSEMWELMKLHGCNFMSLRENFDTTTAAGEMVLYTVANIAQFERRQCAERVRANFVSRASRGLSNGGQVPMGYLLDPEKPGNMIVDPKTAAMVRKAFEVFLEKQTLTRTAAWLNENGYRVKRMPNGGGPWKRLGQFTFGTIHKLLTNPAYAGIRVYKDLKGEWREVPAVWEPIIAPKTFKKVQTMLKSNRHRFKPCSAGRYPYVLSGLVRCGVCGDTLSGKTAHGNSGKVGYYEHSWAQRKRACLVKKILLCEPKRIMAKRLEPVVWEKLVRLLNQPEFARGIIAEAKKLHEKKSRRPELARLQRRSRDLDAHLDSLTERLAELPKGVSATPIYRQMEKIEVEKSETEVAISSHNQGIGAELPAAFTAYENFLHAVQMVFGGVLTAEALDPAKEDACRRLVKSLIHQVEVFPEKLRLHYYAGQSHTEREPPNGGSRLKVLKPEDAKNFGSRSLTIGAPGRDRTAKGFGINPLIDSARESGFPFFHP